MGSELPVYKGNRFFNKTVLFFINYFKTCFKSFERAKLLVYNCKDCEFVNFRSLSLIVFKIEFVIKLTQNPF